MKKKTLLLLALFSLLSPTLAFAADESINSLAKNETSEVASNREAEQTTNETSTSKSEATESSSTPSQPEEVLPPPSKDELTIIMHDGQIKRGQAVSLELIKKLINERGYTFVSYVSSEPNTSQAGFFETKINVTRNKDNSQQVMTLDYLVMNDVATLKIEKLTYDKKSNTLSGTVTPAGIYLINVRNKKNEGVGAAYSKENGEFSFVLDKLGEADTEITVEAKNDVGLYSQAVPFNLNPAQATTPSSTPPATKANANILPKAGEKTSILLTMIGITFIGIAAFVARRKKTS